MRRVLKWLRWALYSVLSVIILVLAIVTAIVATEPGSRFAVQQAASRLPVEVGEVRGNLITGLDVDHVEYQLEEQSYRVEDLSFRWQPLALLYNTVSVQSLSASSVILKLPPPVDEPEPAEPEPPQWPSLALPVRVELGGVDLRDIRIHQGETETRLHGISGTLSLGAFSLRVWDLAVVGPDYELGLNGRAGLRYPYGANLRLRWRYTLPDMGGQPMTFRGDAEVNGDLTSVTASHRLRAPATIESELRFWPNLNDLDGSPKLVMDSSWPEQLLPPALFPEALPTVETGGRIQLEGWLDDYLVQLSGNVRAEGVPPLDLDLKGQGNLEQLDLESLEVNLPEGSLTSRGQVQWAPAVQWDLSLALDELNPASLPLPALAEWPGFVNGRLSTRGALEAAGLRASVDGIALEGRVREMAIAAGGNLTYSQERIESRNLVFALGANQVILSGSMAEEFDINAYVSAPILDQLDPSLAGELTLDAQLQGSVARPRGRVHLEGSDLKWQDYSVGQIALDLERDESNDYRLDLTSGPWDLAGQTLDEALISASGSLEQHELSAQINTDAWGDLGWTLSGGYVDAVWSGELSDLILQPNDPLLWKQQNSAPLTLSADEISLATLCLTPQSRWAYQGIQNLRDEDESQSGDEAAKEAEPSQNRQDGGWDPREALAQVAWMNEGLICLQGQWQAEAGSSAQASIKGLPLRLARRWVKQNVDLKGTLEGEASFTQTAQEGPRAHLRLDTRDGAVEYQFDEEDTERYAWDSTHLEANWQPDQISGEMNTNWGEFGQASATFGLVPQSGELEGRIQANFGRLDPLEALIPRLHEVGGKLNADLNLAGRLQQPELRGTIALREGTAKLPELGLHLEQLSLTAEATVDRLDLSGEVTSGEGRLELTGEITDFWSANRQVRASLGGSDFQAINTRELMVLVSPDMTLDLNSERVLLEGEARIPKARAKLKELPESATQVSDDVVIKDPEGGREADAMGRSLRMDLTLVLGDDVRFEGFGLTSRLSGQLQVIQNPERGLLTVGEVGVAEGRYKAYGQDLDIERGRLIFQGPYDNPGLDIRAVRETDEYTAGLEIEGTLQRPRSRVFSEPSLSDSNAMAVLFTGKPLGAGSSQADASMLVNAIGGLGLERSGFITAEIADTFSLDEFRIQTEDDVTESSLLIGKYITPKLLVRYVVGLFGQAPTIGLRYEITEELRLEAESGIKQSVDLIYKFER